MKKLIDSKKLVLSAIALMFAFAMPAMVEAHCGQCGLGDKAKGKDLHQHEKLTEGQLCLECVSKMMRLTKEQKEALHEAFHAYNASVVKAKTQLAERVASQISGMTAEKFKTVLLGKKKEIAKK